jgi:hypothetical protein
MYQLQLVTNDLSRNHGIFLGLLQKKKNEPKKSSSGGKEWMFIFFRLA